MLTNMSSRSFLYISSLRNINDMVVVVEAVVQLCYQTTQQSKPAKNTVFCLDLGWLRKLILLPTSIVVIFFVDVHNSCFWDVDDVVGDSGDLVNRICRQ